MENNEALEASEYYDLLRSLCRREDTPLRDAYREMRELLEHLCRSQMADGHLQMTDLAARIN